jgi:hypothetical protein
MFQVRLTGKLRDYGWSGQGDPVAIGSQSRQIIAHGDLGMVRANANTLAAVNAALLDNTRLAFPYPDGFCRAVFDTVGTAFTFILFQAYGMEITHRATAFSDYK